MVAKNGLTSNFEERDESKGLLVAVHSEESGWIKP